MCHLSLWATTGLLWASLAGPAWSADPAELDRLGLAYCQSIGHVLRVAAAARDAGVPEAAQQQQAARHVTDADTDRLTRLSIARVYRDRRPGSVLAEEVIAQCWAVLPHRVP